MKAKIKTTKSATLTLTENEAVSLLMLVNNVATRGKMGEAQRFAQKISAMLDPSFSYTTEKRNAFMKNARLSFTGE